MRRLALLSFLAAFAACGGNNSANNPDAPVILTADAPPPDAGPPDALVCNAPTMNCGDICIDVSTDEQNCGSCSNVCQGGAYCDNTCMCPGAFLPGTPAAAGQFFAISQFNLNIGIGPTANTNGLNALIVAVGDGTTVTGQDYTLSGGSLTPPIVAAAYNVTAVNPPTADAYYLATAGTVNFTTLCAHEIAGTLTDVTYSGATGSATTGFQVDPNGCTFTISGAMQFDIKDGTPCM